MQNDKKVIKVAVVSNLVAEAKQARPYSVQEQRLLLWILSQTHEDDWFKGGEYIEDGIYLGKEISISGKEYIKDMNLDIKDMPKEIYKVCLSLSERVIHIRQKEEWIMVHWFYSISYSEIDHMIKFKLHPEIIPHIFSLKSNFTQLEISYIFKLESMYAIRLYMILACNKKYGKTFTLDRFKDMMGIKDKKTYRLYGNIKQEVLNIAKKEINEKTDIQFDYEENKAGREVVSLKFKVFKGKRINSKSIRYKDEIKRIKAPLCDEAKKFFGRVKK